MATADLSFEMRIKGTPEEVASILDIMLEYKEGKDGAYFSAPRITVGDKSFSTISGLFDKDELAAAIAGNSGTVEISAMGPFGRYCKIDDVDILRDMAKAAPNAYFTASIEGFAGYADQHLSAELSGGKMHVSTYYLSDDCRADGERDYFESILPYDKFIELFKLDSEEFDEEMYEDFLIDAIGDFDGIGEFFEETDFEEFVDMLDAECPLTEDEYDEIIEEFTGLASESFSDYLEREDYAQQESYTYDPVEKKYTGCRGPKMKSGVAYSINDDIRAYLDSIGHPSDDETINALSVEDVYAILAGTYGKDDSAEGNEDEAADCEEEEISEDLAEDPDEDESEEDKSEEDESDNQEAAAAETDTENVVSEPVTADTADTKSETTTEADNNSPAKKKFFPVWLIVLLAAIILIGVAAYVFGFGEKIFNYIADLLDIAARLM